MFSTRTSCKTTTSRKIRVGNYLSSSVIGDNYFNWPIISLSDRQRKLKYNLLHVFYSVIIYPVRVKMLYFLVFGILATITLIGQLPNKGIISVFLDEVSYAV